MAGISVWQLLILLAIVVLLFGTKKLRNVGGDMGAFIREFKGALGQQDDTAMPEVSGDVSLTDKTRDERA